VRFHRHLVPATLWVAWFINPAVSSAQTASSAQTTPITVTADPGTVVRWTVPGTKRCGMNKRSWEPLQETCYYPVDLFQKPVVIKINRQGAGRPEQARISVGPYPYGTESVELGDIPQANPSPEDLRRNERDQMKLRKVWARREGPARFTLPLAAPVNPLPEGKSFGSEWIFNGKTEESDLHTGVDYAVTAGTPVASIADGTVVIAEEMFYPGNAVFIDHGDGLISMYFHLSELRVQPGQDVERGETIGVVGSTGRASGPHLHLGVRWHGARVDPRLLLEDPAKIQAVSQ
jgi:murein DD-endopeptidase MepM/ murein hydrolase activator NlpD